MLQSIDITDCPVIKDLDRELKKAANRVENGLVDISGFIDMGNCGIADKWEDIAMLYRSLRHYFDGTYGKVYPGLDPDSFFEELGIEPDREKIDYYILLDELF